MISRTRPSLLLALTLFLAMTVPFGSPVYGQSQGMAIEQWTYGPIGTIAAPHGAGVQLTDVATGAEQPTTTSAKS